MKTLLMLSLIFFSACFTNLYAQTDYQNPESGSSSFLVKTNSINFEFHQITDKKNSYTLQSNASPQQIWYDLEGHLIHTVFTNSQVQSPFFERTCIYFGSTDYGLSWIELGPVPDSSRAGYPAIYGTSNGEAVIVDHSSYFDMTTRTGIFIDNSPFEYNFTSNDPGIQPVTIWPRCIVTPNNKVLIAAHTTTGPAAGNLALNTFDPDSGTFSGWLIVAPTGPETYSLSISNAGKIGVTFLGDGIDDGDVLYLESTDNGISWSPRLKIFDCPAEQGIAVGSFRGISLNFYGEEPCIVFEVCQQNFNTGVYYPRLPNEILFWSPNVNGGISKVIADSSNVPFAPSLNQINVFLPVCRPVIGRSQNYDYLFVAFSVATENVLPGSDSTTYFGGYFMYSSDGGESWANPEKFTPDTPLLDWKYISIAPICPAEISNLDKDYTITIHMTLQGDSLTQPGPHPIRTAKYFHVSSVPYLVSIEENPVIVNEFKLHQNYPNPFNPTTAIRFTILKVYDVLGNEIATLVNEEKPAGEYEVEFNANSHSGEVRNLPSGIYFYRLQAGFFIEIKKMILIK